MCGINVLIVEDLAIRGALCQRSGSSAQDWVPPIVEDLAIKGVLKMPSLLGLFVKDV